MKKFKIIILIAVISFTTTSYGQINEDEDDIEETTAVGEGIRKIKLTKKKSSSPKLIEDTTKSQLESKYIFYDYKAKSNLQLQPIKPAKIKIIDPLDKLKRGYIKAGIGMYTTPLAELYYNSLRSKNSNWGINLRHISSNTSLKETGFSGLSENQAGIFYTHYLKKYSVKSEINYDRQGSHFYGFNSEDTTIDKKEINQAFNEIGAKVTIASFHKIGKEVNYEGSIGYTNYSDLFKAMEHNAVLEFKAKKSIDSEIYGVDFGVDFNNYARNNDVPLNVFGLYQVKEKITNNTIIKLMPNITTSGKKWYVKAGLGVFVDVADKSSFHFYPKVEAKYSFHDIFVPYIGVDGGVTRNSFRTLSKENPFVLSDVNLQNTNTKYNVYVGIRGSISNTVSFNLQGARKKIYGMPLYFNDTTFSIQNKMDVLYDSLDVTALLAQVTYQEGEKLRVYLKGEFNIYSPLNQKYVWNKPALDITLGGIYDLADKILVRLDVYFIGDRKAKSLTDVEGSILENGSYTVNQKAFVDFNLGFEYRYSKRVSAFLNFNNIISKKYNLYHKYPVQGINILGGATFSF